MKDTVDQIYDKLNAQVVRMLEHSSNQAARIADLERENSSLAYELNVAQSGGSVAIPASVPSAQAVEPQLVALNDPWVIAVRKAEHYCPSELSTTDRWRWKAQFLLNELAAPQAADTDKVREAIPDGCALGWNGTIYHGISEIYHQMEEGAALHMVLDEKSVPRADKDGCVYSLVGRVEQYVAANMAAQAPVREVPETYKLVPIRPNWNMLDALYGKGWIERSPAEQVGMLQAYRNMLDAAALNLPAAPVQQEGE